MSIDRQQARAFALLGLVVLFWAGNSIIARAVRFDVPPFTLAFMRWSGALLLVAPFAIRPLRRDARVLLQNWKVVLLLGMLGIGAFNGLLYSGLQYTTAANALLMQAAVPALVAILDRLFFGARQGVLSILGVTASILGVVVIVFEGNPAAALGLRFGFGDALILGSVVIWSLYTALLRLRPAVSPISFIATTFAIGVVMMGPLAFGEWGAGRTIVWGPAVAGAFLYLAVLPSIASYFIYNSAAHTVGPVRAGQAITMLPVFGALLSAALLGEPLYLYHFIGMACIVTGIVLGALGITSLDSRSKAGGAGLMRRLEDRT